jgi:thiol:disulfide interchange protein DsbD
MPRAGGWMNNLKVVMGFMEIAAAIKFFSNADLVLNIGILPKEVFLAIWIGCSLLIVLYILGTFQMKLDSPVEKVSAVRATFAVMFASIAIWLLSGLFGKPLGELDAFLPPPDYRELMSGVSAASTAPKLDGSAAAEPVKETWLSSLDEAMKLSKATGQSIFIDFTGFTCTNCRWMEINMFPRTNIQERMEKMIKVRLYTDRKQEPYISNQNLQKERFGSVALPLYVILDKEGKEVAKTAFTRDMNAFQSFLDRGL